MLKGMGDLAKLMSQAGEIQRKMAEAQERVGELRADGSAGAGMVKATATGKGELVALSVDQSLVDGTEDKAVLEDLIIAAVNDATLKARELATEEMAKVTEGLPLPPGMKSPFT
ncbi:MAG: YbaB/EbfC family nucleoid-associated protein [Pseudomonadota bacterium]